MSTPASGRRSTAAAGALAAIVIALAAGAAAPTLKPVAGDYGRAPELVGIDTWLNSPPLTMESLRGRVVLIDFWTYSCINCLRALPHVIEWHDKFADKGLVVIGVHTPEFDYEKGTEGLRTAMERFGVRHAVAQDNQRGTWKAWDNHYWPAVYLVDKRGRVVLRHFGEGAYDEIESAIRVALAEP